MKALLRILTRATAFVLVASSAIEAQTAAPPSTAVNTKVKTRQLAAPLATSTEVLGSLAAVRQLPNGNVLVNDQARHRVLLMDKLLNVVSVVADSTSNTGNAYGVRPGGLLAYRGDSTLFIDPASMSMLVIDPTGVIARTMAAPRPNDVNSLIGGPQGNPGFDAKGRLVYRAPFSFTTRGPSAPGTPFMMPTLPDSAALVRFDLTTRKLDTAAFFKLAKVKITTIPDDNGGIKSMSVMTNPLPVVDDWAVLTDGTIAVVRGQDYHVDLIDASGTVKKSDKVPYDWQRMTDDDKQNYLDSTRVAMEKQRAANMPAAAADKPAGGAAGAPGTVADKTAAVSAAAEGGMTMRMQVGGAGAPPAGGPQVMSFGGPGGNATLPPINLVPISDLPDYKPVFGPGAIRSDMDGHLWIRTIATKPGGPIYEVLDSSGKLVDRVQFPVGTTIAGFGEGGVIYLGFRDAAGIHVQRVLSK